MHRGPKGEERRQNRKHDFDQGILDPSSQAQHEPADANAPQDFADDDGGKQPGSLGEREETDGDGANGEAIKDERGGIVGQSLAFEHDEDAAGNFHPASDGEGGNGVGRRDDGPQQEPDRPRKIHDPMRRGGDCKRREHDASHR